MQNIPDDGLDAFRGFVNVLKIYVIAIAIGSLIYWIF